MPSSNQLIDKIAVFIALLWIVSAALAAIELVGHLIDKTSDTRSQLWRMVFVIIFVISALCCSFRFRGWRWIILAPCLFIAMRDYFYLMVPHDLDWNADQILAFARLVLVLATIALAALWGRYTREAP